MTATRPPGTPTDGIAAADTVAEILAAGATLLGATRAGACLHDRLVKVRECDKGFYATFASALEASGHSLGPAWAGERSLIEHRAVRCAGVSARLADAAGATELKGQRLAAVYPPSVLRQCRDLDLQVEDAEHAFVAAEVLTTAGWRLDSLVLLPAGEHPDLLLEFSRPRPTIGEAPDKVELTTLLLQGDGLRMARARRLPGVSGESALLAAVAAEGMDRPFKLRDYTDAHLLLRRLDPPARHALRTAADATGLGRYLTRLIRATRRYYPADTAGLISGGPESWRRRSEGVRRRAADVIGGRPAVRVAQILAVYHRRTWTESLLNRTAVGFSAPGALESGLNLYCVPAHGPASDRLTFTGPGTISTPAGTFVAVPGTRIPSHLGEALGLDDPSQ